MCGIMCIDRIRNKEVTRTGVTRELSAKVGHYCFKMIWQCGENGERPSSREDCRWHK